MKEFSAEFFCRVQKSMCEKLGYSETEAKEIMDHAVESVLIGKKDDDLVKPNDIVTAIYRYAKTFGYPKQNT